MPPEKPPRRQKTRQYSGRRMSVADDLDLFDILPEEIIVCIFAFLSSTASSPSDLLNLLPTCRRLNSLVMDSFVLSKASAKCFTPSASGWCYKSQNFIKSCAIAGNPEACYTLGMIRFYCLRDEGGGASLMAKAAMMGSHPQALYSLAVILFNGSGGSKNDKDLRAGVALCARAAAMGHIDAIRELGHCLQDGYGVRQNIGAGRRFLVDANARELSSVVGGVVGEMVKCGSPLLSDYGCNVPEVEPHPASRFMMEWFEIEGGEGEGWRRVCSHAGCGRRETRKHEFRRCSVCGGVTYCSRACQALDWKIRHKDHCIAPVVVVEVGDDSGVAEAALAVR